MKFNISGIFYSLQGEGYWAGTPAIFIRLAGCNLSCPWCDTPDSKTCRGSFSVSAEFLIDRIESLLRGCREGRDSVLLVITGGEPTLQNYNLLVLVLRNFFPRNKISLETNGRMSADVSYRYLREEHGLWTSVSPKLGIDPDCPSYFANKDWRGDELKVVYDSKGKGNHLLFRLPELLGDRFKHYYIQPCSEDYGSAVDFVKENQKWRLSIQTQKILKIQ